MSASNHAKTIDRHSPTNVRMSSLSLYYYYIPIIDAVLPVSNFIPQVLIINCVSGQLKWRWPSLARRQTANLMSPCDPGVRIPPSTPSLSPTTSVQLADSQSEIHDTRKNTSMPYQSRILCVQSKHHPSAVYMTSVWCSHGC